MWPGPERAALSAFPAHAASTQRLPFLSKSYFPPRGKRRLPLEAGRRARLQRGPMSCSFPVPGLALLPGPRASSLSLRTCGPCPWSRKDPGGARTGPERFHRRFREPCVGSRQNAADGQNQTQRCVSGPGARLQPRVGLPARHGARAPLGTAHPPHLSRDKRGTSTALSVTSVIAPWGRRDAMPTTARNGKEAGGARRSARPSPTL